MPNRERDGKAALALSIILGAFGIGGGVYWLRFDGQRTAAAPVLPRIARVEMRSLDAAVTATGTIRLRTGAEVRVGSQISGIVTRLNVTVGSHVEKDAVIAEIDARGLDARIDQAQSQIAMDQAALHKLQVQMARTSQLVKEGLIPRQTGEDLEEDVKNAEAKVRKSKSDLEVVKSDTPYLTIRAPISGTVASVSTLQGETVAASFNAPTFVTIIADNALEMVAMVDETDIAGVRPRNAVTFTTETYPGRDFHGRVERIAPKATIVSGVVNYEVGISLREESAMLKPDMTVNATIQTSHRNVLAIPTKAIQSDGRQKFALVLKNRIQEKRNLIVGQRQADWTEVKNGLTVDEAVIVPDSLGATK